MLLLWQPTIRTRFWVYEVRIVALYCLLAVLTMMSPKLMQSSRWCPGRDAWMVRAQSSLKLAS